MARSRLVLIAALVAALFTPIGFRADAADGPLMDPAVAALVAADDPAIPVIVQYSEPPSDLDRCGLVEEGLVPGMGFRIVPAIAAVGPAAAIKALAGNPRVVSIEHDRTLSYQLDRATAAGRATPVWSATYRRDKSVVTGGITGRGIGVGIIDSGIDARHPDLLHTSIAEATGQPAKTIANYKLVGRENNDVPGQCGVEFLTEPAAIDMVNTDNTGGHGTHVAGVAAGNGAASNGAYRGAAPGAHLIGFGAGETLSVHLALAAADWIHNNRDYARHELGMRVINMSFGAPGDYNPGFAATRAIQQLVADGFVVVVAAGNFGGDGSAIDTNLLANIPGVVSVANFYERTGWLDGTSSRGQRGFEDTWPDVAAPGTEIVSTAALAGPVTYYGSAQDAVISVALGYGEPNVVPAPTPSPTTQPTPFGDVVVGDYASMTGTSMASPFVAGVVALMLEANPALTPSQVTEILRATATMPAGRTYEGSGFEIGKGVVDAAEAVAVALQMPRSKSVAQAVGKASLDLASSPARINLDEGPVTDQTIPLAPPAPAEPGPPPPLGGFSHVHTAGVDPRDQLEINTRLVYDVLLGPGGVQEVVAGTPISVETHRLASNDPARPLQLAAGQVSHQIAGPDGSVFATAGATLTKEERSYRAASSWTVPPDAPSGTYVVITTVTWNGVPYRLADSTFNVNGVA